MTTEAWIAIYLLVSLGVALAAWRESTRIDQQGAVLRKIRLQPWYSEYLIRRRRKAFLDAEAALCVAFLDAAAAADELGAAMKRVFG
jgi:hypothetical protein